jgi:hypothetical protein
MRQVHQTWSIRQGIFAVVRSLKRDSELYREKRAVLIDWTWRVRRDLAALRFQKDNPPPK